MEYVTKLVPRGADVIEIESNDPEVVAELERVAKEDTQTDSADTRRFQVASADARLHFPHLFEERAA